MGDGYPMSGKMMEKMLALIQSSGEDLKMTSFIAS